MTIEEMRTIDAVKTYKELEEARDIIRRLQQHEVSLMDENRRLKNELLDLKNLMEESEK
jgi:hypothetical protein